MKDKTMMRPMLDTAYALEDMIKCGVDVPSDRRRFQIPNVTITESRK